MKSEISIAAKWWADQVRNGAKQDNGEEKTSIFLSVLASQLSKPTEKQITQFEQSIVDGINKENNTSITIIVDYHPEGILADACQKAQIDRLHVPIKTIMYIEPGSVRVCNGYGSDEVELFKCSE